MIYYLETIIIQSIDNSYTSSELGATPPCPIILETDNKFHIKLSIDSNVVACKKQVYLSNYNTTYFKYSQKGQRKDACRFGILQDLLPSSIINKLKVIHLAWNHS